MASLKDIKVRITSISSTMQITSAMKMVSAAKLKKSQDAINGLRIYSDKLRDLIGNLSASIDRNELGNPFLNEKGDKNILLVAIASNKGLCGGFNAAIVKEVSSMIKSNKDSNINILTIGKKINEILKRQYDINKDYSDIYNNLAFENSKKISDFVMSEFENNSYDKVYIIYNKSKNASTQIITKEQLLPIVLPEMETQSDYIFEPSKEQLMASLIPKSISTQIYGAILDSFASEHGARMTAMHKATDNCIELQGELKLTYNKIRQAAITKEILEIVSGAEALNS